ncbi:MAG: glycosyltransferase family 4 protein [Sphingobacteriales bacterium]|nr:glycosyltransferase family 4 protein [Sphingobacteriales bacterium]
MNNSVKILGLINEKNDPASRARILQYIPSLEREQIFVKPRVFHFNENSDPAAWMFKVGKITSINPWRLLWLAKNITRLPLLYEQFKYDLIWQNRLILKRQSWCEKKIQIPRIFDFDDAIWLQDGEKEVQKAISSAVQVFAGNEYLADYASQYSSNVCIIPSVIDTSALYPIKGKDGPFTIGWIGSAPNLPYLELVKPAIDQFLQQNPDTCFTIVSSSPGNIFNYDNRRIRFIPWSTEKENELINSFSVGLMPLQDTSFTRGKCSFKMLQYMACGVPVLVSPVGSNELILRESQAGLSATDTNSWLTGLRTFKEDHDFYTQTSGNGPGFVESHYSVNKYAPRIADCFRNLIVK